MIILKKILIQIFSGSLLFSSLLASAQNRTGKRDVLPKIESKLVVEQDDTFPIVGGMEIYHVEIGKAPAEYNQFPFFTVFSSHQEFVYSNQFAAKPSSVEVYYAKGKVRNLSGGNAYLTGQLVKALT